MNNNKEQMSNQQNKNDELSNNEQEIREKKNPFKEPVSNSDESLTDDAEAEQKRKEAMTERD